MFEALGITPQALYSQLLVGLINGSFYAVLSLGLAVIFGMLNIINFSHGAQYMMGAFLAWLGSPSSRGGPVFRPAGQLLGGAGAGAADRRRVRRRSLSARCCRGSTSSIICTDCC